MKSDYDLIVIGSGVAGALVAWKLAEAGRRVLIIDAGTKQIEDADRANFVTAFAQALQKDKTPSEPYQPKAGNAAAKVLTSPDVVDFKLIGQPGDKPYFIQVGPDVWQTQYTRLVGGTTWSWRGNCPRFIPNDFRLQTLYQQGVDWPIEYEHLEKWYCDAEDALGVSGNHDEWNNLFGAYRSRKFPMDEIAQAYGDRQLKKALDGLQTEDTKVKVVSLPQARNSRPYDDRPACHGNSNCIPICPIQAKYDATVHVKKALKLKANLIDKAIVTDLALNSEGNIDGVAYRTWDDPQEQRVKAKIVVLAANGIESPKLLLMSNQRRGVANSSDQVGRNLMDHLGGEGAALMPFQVFPFRGPQSTSSIESFRDHKFRTEKCAFRLTIGNDGWGRTKHPFDTLKELTDRKLFGEELQKELLHTVSRQLRIAYSTEQLPNPNNRVMLSDQQGDFGMPKPIIEFKVDDYSRKGMEYAQQVIKNIFTAIRAPEETWEFTDLQGPRFFSGSGHIMGTCRMGGDTRNSVVDAECRSHDHRNLFIVGSSVFPTAGTTNPTVTLAALALRAAASIHAQL